MAVAPLLAGWWLKQGVQIPTSPTGSGGSQALLNDGAPVQVEVLIDGQWENFSQNGWVRYDDRVDISSYGQSSQGSQTDPARCTFRLKNTEAMGWPFSDGNVTSPYWGKFGRNTRVRISVPDGFAKSFRFQGEINEIDEEADISGNDTTVLVVAVGILDRLGRGDKPLRSTLYREIMSTDPLGTRTRPVAYWPMEDNEGAESLTNVVAPSREMRFNGDPALRAYDGFACSEAVPNVSGTQFTARVSTYSFPGSVAGPRASSVWFILNADAITTNMVLLRVATASHQFDISYVATDNIRMVITALDGGAVLFDSGSVAVSAGILGQNSWFCLHIEDVSNQQIYSLNHQNMATTTLSGLMAHNAAGASTGPVRRVQVNPNGIAGDVHIGQIAVFKHKQDDANIANGYVPTNLCLAGFASERADVRFGRLCQEEGITYEVTDALTPNPFVPGTFTGVGQRMGIQRSNTLLDLLRECETADGGLIYETTADFGLGYRTLASMTSQDPALTLSQGSHDLSRQPQPLRDNNGNINEFTATREGGSSATYSDDTSKMGTLPPPAGIGRYNNQGTYSLFSDTQTLDQAGWAVHKGTWPEPRFEAIEVNLSRPNFTGLPLRSSALAVVAGDRVDIGDLPVRLGYEDIAQLAIGRAEKIDQFIHEITYNAVPERPYRTTILDDDEYDRLDMGDSHLVNAVGATDTSLEVNSLDGMRWADTPQYAAEFPFDIMIEGERMTVTAVYDDAFDDFSDTQVDTWGNADYGGLWTNSGGAAGDYDKTSGLGTHTHTSANVLRTSSLLDTNLASLDVVADIQTAALSTGNSQYAGVTARFTDVNNLYWGRLEFLTTGVIELEILKRVGGVQTQIGATFTTALTHAADTSYRVRFRLAGTLLKARVWLASATEPAFWQVVGTDTALTTGSVGMATIRDAANTNANAVMRTDNFRASGVGSRQLFVVTRSVNSVVKPHTAGADVHTYHAHYLAL